MAFQRGDVLLIPFPFSDLNAIKVRPAIVVSSPLYHNTEPDLLLAGVSSNTIAGNTAFDYVLHDWRAAGLIKPSSFKPVLTTLVPWRVIRHIGALTAVDLLAVEERLRRMLHL
jgi:mRNA interferase MazF